MPRDKITSLANPRVKELVRLRAGGRRKSPGVTIVDGSREILRALEGGVKFREFYVCPELIGRGQEEAGLKVKLSGVDVPVLEVTKAVFAKIAYGDREEGVLGICETPRRSLADFRIDANALVGNPNLDSSPRIPVSAPSSPTNEYVLTPPKSCILVL